MAATPQKPVAAVEEASRGQVGALAPKALRHLAHPPPHAPQAPLHLPQTQAPVEVVVAGLAAPAQEDVVSMEEAPRRPPPPLAQEPLTRMAPPLQAQVPPQGAGPQEAAAVAVVEPLVARQAPRALAALDERPPPQVEALEAPQQEAQVCMASQAPHAHALVQATLPLALVEQGLARTPRASLEALEGEVRRALQALESKQAPRAIQAQNVAAREAEGRPLQVPLLVA
mmetsp:Transcript_34042/g.83717  ORF Transcript_34042/g.83717 Transcript_34042/m.83717 type:complete len:228 (+) Transcript_34042:2024-2707(+)